MKTNTVMVIISIKGHKSLARSRRAPRRSHGPIAAVTTGVNGDGLVQPARKAGAMVLLDQGGGGVLPGHRK